jgi:hypothetical protein
MAPAPAVEARRFVDEAITPDETVQAERRYAALRESLDGLVDRALGLTESDLAAIQAVSAP